MKQKIISILLLAAMMIGLLPQGVLPVNAYSDTDIAYPVEGGNLYFDKATGTITGCDESVTKADIPAQIEGVAVTSIGDWAFYDCSSLMSVTIPGGVTSIGNSAFDCCGSLTSVTLPDSVTSIGRSAFYDCSSLISIFIPDRVTSIGAFAFWGCSSLTSINIPDSVTSIGCLAFADTAIYNAEESWIDGVLYFDNWLLWSENIVSGEYVVASGTTGIADNVFVNCESLTSVTIPDSVIIIGSYAFAECGLTSITIPDSVTSIGEGAFSGCSSLTEISVAEDNTVYTSENGVLFDKAKTALLTYPAGKPKAEYVIPDSVTSIGTYAFSTCYNLTDITIPDSVTSIGTYAFSACYNLTDITIPDSVTSIGADAFSHCCSLTSVTLSSSVTSIDEYTFSRCGKLTSVTIPNSVTSIGSEAFSACSSLTDVTIPDSVTSIGAGAFLSCRSLTSVHIPDSVTSIGWEAFADTAIYNAEERWIDGVLYLDNWLLEAEATVSGDYAVASGTTGIADGAFYGAFYGCSNLTSVTIPNSVTSIGEAAFYDCDNLQAVYFMGNAPALGVDVFNVWDAETQTIINLPDLTLYYIEGKEGWTSPTWNGYPTATWVPTYSYTDVSEKEWYFDAVQYASQNGLMNGVGNGKFDPEGSMTRAMLVTVLWRYEGEPAEGENTFTDVPNGTWYTDAVAWAAEKGIVGGIGNGKFDPEGNITREQMATILFRYAQKKCINTSKRGDLSGFADSGNVSSWAKDAVQWTVAEGIINGSDGKLLAQGNATRAQVSAILMRFLENIVKD